MEEKNAKLKRNVVRLDPDAMKATLELRHLKEQKLGRTVSMKEAMTDAIMEKYVRDVKREDAE